MLCDYFIFLGITIPCLWKPLFREPFVADILILLFERNGLISIVLNKTLLVPYKASCLLTQKNAIIYLWFTNAKNFAM
jgi:hypothetical protein